MAAVQAVQSKDDINIVHDFILRHYNVHFADLWKLNCNLALRVGDALSLTMDKAREALQSGYLIINESKTGWKKCKETGERIRTQKPPRVIKLNKTAREILAQRVEEYPHFIYLFQSESRNLKTLQPYSRQNVRIAFNEAGKKLGLNLGTHSCRKSRGAIMHNDGVSIEKISKLLGHNDVGVTTRYIGIEQQHIDELNEEYEL